MKQAEKTRIYSLLVEGGDLKNCHNYEGAIAAFKKAAEGIAAEIERVEAMRIQTKQAFEGARIQKDSSPSSPSLPCFQES